MKQRILLDPSGLRLFTLIAANKKDYSDVRHYYVALYARAIVVARNGMKLGVELANQVTDAEVSTDAGTRGFVFEGEEGKLHAKATLFRIVRVPATITLSEFLRSAPFR